MIHQPQTQHLDQKLRPPPLQQMNQEIQTSKSRQQMRTRVLMQIMGKSRTTLANQMLTPIQWTWRAVLLAKLVKQQTTLPAREPAPVMKWAHQIQLPVIIVKSLEAQVKLWSPKWEELLKWMQSLIKVVWLSTMETQWHLSQPHKAICNKKQQTMSQNNLWAEVRFSSIS